MGILTAIKRRLGRRAAKKFARQRLGDFMARLDTRLGARRQAWDQEDSELKAVMAAATGSTDWGQMMARLGIRDRKSFDELKGVSARFDSALTTDDNRQHWSMADGLAADASANPMIRYTLRNRARYEVHNNCYARGVGETIANDFVGTGPRLHIDDDRLSDDERSDVESKFIAWANTINLPGKLRTMRKARRQDGEVFATKITNPNLNSPIKLDLRVIEADQVRFVDVNLLLVPSVDGIRFDDYGNPVSYHILRVHPGYWSYATGYVGFPWEYDVWDARYVIHWFRQDRPGQHRGLPEILPALPLYATLRRYTQATLDAAETAADFAIILQTQASAAFYNDANEEVNNDAVAAFSSVALERRMMIAAPAGYEAKQLQPEHPQQQYSAFKREICGEIGRCESVPLNVVLADSSGSNFASGQLDHKIYFRTRDIERAEANNLILDNLLSDWIAEGTRLRDDDGKPYLPSALKTLGLSVDHTWYWDSNELGDPLKLAAAKQTELSTGQTTLPAVWEAKGGNWRKAFQTAARAYGVSFEEVQDLVRNQIFSASAKPEPEIDQPGGDTGTVKPGQAATQGANQ